MRKFMILFLFVFTVSYAQDFNVAMASDARLLYTKMLKMLQTDTCFPCPLKWGGLYTWGHFFDEKKNIDSVTAVSIAVKTTQICFGQNMAALPPRLMGDNEEFWLVYCFPSILFEKRWESSSDHLVWRYENGRLLRLPKTTTEIQDGKIQILYSNANIFEKWTFKCYFSLMRRYKSGMLFTASTDLWNPLPDGFQLIVVLISKANGQVLSMKEIKG